MCFLLNVIFVAGIVIILVVGRVSLVRGFFLRFVFVSFPHSFDMVMLVVFHHQVLKLPRTRVYIKQSQTYLQVSMLLFGLQFMAVVQYNVQFERIIGRFAVGLYFIQRSYFFCFVLSSPIFGNHIKFTCTLCTHKIKCLQYFSTIYHNAALTDLICVYVFS